ncbi:MAG TPA: tetratricopeptide repeat protein [Kofleriaceae bacterium]|jgi:tetratricopeptide (TPR) repeat protein
MRKLATFLTAGFLAFGSVAYADEADAHYKSGLAYKQEGKTDQAIAELEACVAANPHHYMAWASLGSLYRNQKHDIPKTVMAYEHAVEGIKKDKVLWLDLGTAYYRNNQLDQALTALQTAAALDPKDADVRGNLGTVRRQKGDKAGAITDLEAAVKLAPTNPEWANNLGVAYRAAGREDDAVKVFQKAIELSPNEARYHFNLAVAYRRQTEKNPDLIPQAIAEYEKATGLDPANADGWFDLGFMYKQDKQNDKSIEAFHHYLELKKDKDPAGAKRVEDELSSMGAAPKSKTPPPPKKK